ncbi:MAG: hypothetical protein U9Q67_02830, partial [Patescibacteria group bacterium]|nr:hypothetical protein [Patescibacteria group bacterium]
MKKLRIPKIRIIFSALLKIVFVAGYTGLCGLILSPQVDYQSWYPSQLGIHNFTLGIDFSEHKKAAIDFSEANPSNEEMTVIVQTIYKRAATSNLNDLYVEMNGSNLELHIPDKPEYDDSFIRTLLAQGKIEIKVPAEGVDLQSNLEMMFSEEGYTDTDIKQDKITLARLISQDEQYDYIEIVTDNEQIEAWKSAAEAAGENNVNAMTNGNLNFSWILPPDDNQQKYPILVFQSGRSDIELIVEQLMNSPLPIEIPVPTISITETLHPINLLYAFITIFSMSVSIALSMKLVWGKQKLSSVVVLALIILGLLVIVKLSPV